jgi:hypothetical protein
VGCNIHGSFEILTETGWYALYPIPSERSYDSYGVLFGVRNYTNSVPVAEGRGFPEDAHWRTKKKNESWKMDAHSHTWMNFKDLEEYDWEQKSIDDRISTIDKFTGKETGKASYTYLQDNPEKAEEMGVYLKHLERRAGDLLGETWRNIIEDMKILSEKYGNEGVRVVVWFDN